MADAADSKSADSNIVWVQVPPPAPQLKIPIVSNKIDHRDFLFLIILLCDF